MFRLFKNKKNKPDPILEALEKQNKRLEELLIERRKERGYVSLNHRSDIPIDKV